MRPLTADLVITGALLTMDETAPRAGALAVVGERIVAVGADTDMPSTSRHVDLSGLCVVPGFHDAHNHMAWYGQSLLELDLGTPPIHDLHQLYAAVREAASQTAVDGWVLGNGYDENKIGAHPERDALDVAAGGRRVLLTHTSGHMAVVSSAVLAELGLDQQGRPVPGGAVVVDAAGRPTGLLQEQAQELVNPLLRPIAMSRLVDAIERAGRRYVAEGLTCVTEAGVGIGWIGRSPVEVAAYLSAREQGRLPVRVEVMPSADSLHQVAAHPEDGITTGLDLGIRTGLGDDRLWIGALKVFLDGSLIGRTAAMTSDFADTPGNRGSLQGEAPALLEAIVAAHQAGWQVAAHAIGDAAIDLALDAVETATRRTPRPDVRHRIEHFGVSRPDQVERAARLGVVAVPQGRFVGEIGDGMLTALGDRAPWAYRLRSLLDAGLVVPGSSDRPVVDGRPLLGIHDMVNRRTGSGRPFSQHEALSPMEALRAYTAGSAYASHRERQRGRLQPGMLADLAVLSQDPTRVDPEAIRDIEVLATVLAGDVVHDRGTGLGE